MTDQPYPGPGPVHPQGVPAPVPAYAPAPRRDMTFPHPEPTPYHRMLRTWTYAPYIVDVMANLSALAETRVHLDDESGMVVLDLEQRR